ncbi:MAG TPA: paraquat-inducible protein A [Candidatus Methanoperedens sp.]|nr:paraquat-inducible protein A [Candidatus Methanoperedens sp.]
MALPKGETSGTFKGNALPAWFLSAAIIVVSLVLCGQIIANSIAIQRNKNDYAELNHVKYGLFSVDEWKRQITAILVEEINKLYLSDANELKLRKHVEVQLNALIDNVDRRIRESNSGSAGGWVRQSLINIFVSLEDIKKGIPEYADAVIREVTKAKTTDQIKTMLNKQLKTLAAETFEKQDTSHMKRILYRTDSKNIQGARVYLDAAIAARQDLIEKQSMLLILLAAIVFAWSGFGTHALTSSRYVLLVLTLVVLLAAGVSTPMIDMEAKISRMSFVLAGYPIHFENQVLYFQSKSILDVFWIMITHKDLQMKLVGILVITFSIFFPLLKIASSLAYYSDFRHARENPVIGFFVLKSGKWSMADVLVVAIFMAYIGFNGIISSQFGQLSSLSQELVILTTNGTSLQPGYYLFLTYTLLALFLSGFLSRTPGSPERT